MDNLTRIVLALSSGKVDRTSWLVKFTNNTANFSGSIFAGPNSKVAINSQEQVVVGGIRVTNVSGSSKYSFQAIKFSPEGDILWAYQYNNPSTNVGDLDRNPENFKFQLGNDDKLFFTITKQTDEFFTFFLDGNGNVQAYSDYQQATLNYIQGRAFSVGGQNRYVVAAARDDNAGAAELQAFSYTNIKSSNCQFLFTRNSTSYQRPNFFNISFSANEPNAVFCFLTQSGSDGTEAFRLREANGTLTQIHEGGKISGQGGGAVALVETDGGYLFLLGEIEKTSQTSLDLGFVRVCNTSGTALATIFRGPDSSSSLNFQFTGARPAPNDSVIVCGRFDSTGDRVYFASYSFNPSTNTITVNWERFVTHVTSGYIFSIADIDNIQEGSSPYGSTTKTVINFSVNTPTISNTAFNYVIKFDSSDPPAPGTYSDLVITDSLSGFGGSSTGNVFNRNSGNNSISNTGTNINFTSYTPGFDTRTSGSFTTTRTQL